jgi:hypothetical protein
MSSFTETANTSSPQYAESVAQNESTFDSVTGLFSNKNLIIIILLVLVILSLIGINILTLSGTIISEITDPLSPIVKGILSSLGFTTGNIIKGSADLVANAADTGIDIAKGTTHSIGDLLINSTNHSGIDTSKQISLTDAIGISNMKGPSINPQPVQSSESTVTSIGAQKPKAGWCYAGDFAGSRGCVEITDHDKCMSGQIFANQSECLKPPGK